MRFKSKKGSFELGSLLPVIQILGIIAILGAVFIVILSNLGNMSLINGVGVNHTGGDEAARAALNSSKYLIKDILVVWLPIIVVVVMAALLIFILVKNMMGSSGKR